MVRFEKGHLDQRGNYRGTSYGLGLGCVGFLFSMFAFILVSLWPFLAFHGAVAWLAEVLYLITAGAVALVIMASRSKGSHRS